MTWKAPWTAPGRAAALYSRLALHVRRGMGTRIGERRFPGRPQAAGIELEAYRPYTPGDDLRHLDWNALGRLDVLLTRRYVAEREVLFHLLVDCSASMGVPVGDGKLAAGCELATALAWVALGSNDAVRATLLRGDREPVVSPVHRRRASVVGVGELLASATAAGALDLGAALEVHARRHPAPGAALVISDFMMDPARLERGVLALRARRWEVVLLQVVGARELEPDFSGGVLKDVESGATHPVALTAAIRRRYQALLVDHLAALGAVAERTRAVYARLVAGARVDEFVAGELGRLGLVRRR